MTHPEINNLHLTETVLTHWELDSPEICEQFNKESPRLIFRIRTGVQDYLLKGLPCSIPETTVKSNVQAHLFLGNENGMAPKLYPTKTGEFYVRHAEYWFYLMEFIDGRKMEETPEDEFLLGAAAKKLHALQGYGIKSPDSQRKERFYAWFRDRSFVREYDAILDALPDFETFGQCFVHTDIGPHNAMLRQDGEVIFIDLDDTGIGSRYLDLGWPFIMQFVDFDHNTKAMNYRFDLALNFLRGYFGGESVPRSEYDRIFDGAIQMHISYMKSYGDDAVEELWKILRFGMEQKEGLWERMQITVRKITDVSVYLPQIDRTDADAEFYKNVSQNSEDLYSVCHADETVGIACIHDDPDAYVYIYIFPEYRHCGYGYPAVCAAEQRITSSPLRSIATAYDSNNKIAKNLAEKCGFVTKFCSSVMTYPGERFELPELPIRQHRDEDFFEAYTLSAEAFHIMRLETGHDPDSVPYPADEEARALCAATADERYVYESDSELLGCAHIDGAEIDNVAIRISQQGKGFGKNFVKYLVNLILEKEIGEPYLYCLVSNQKAWQLYASLGFRETMRNEYAEKRFI